jgi:hypothetical protein
MKAKLGAFLISGAISSTGFSGTSDVCTNYPGVYICEQGAVDSIDGLYGSVVLKNVQVSGVVKGNFGAIDINKSKMNAIKGNMGSFIANQSTFSGNIEGNIGSLEFRKSTLNEINAHASNVSLYNSTAEKITLLSTEKKIKLNLCKKSMVYGDISFPEQAGEVCIDKSSALKGSVINGVVVKEPC